jgi:hypothetical protein
MLKHVQTISSVPRTLGADVKPVFSGGREQVGIKERGMARRMHLADMLNDVGEFGNALMVDLS